MIEIGICIICFIFGAELIAARYLNKMADEMNKVMERETYRASIEIRIWKRITALRSRNC